MDLTEDEVLDSATLIPFLLSDISLMIKYPYKFDWDIISLNSMPDYYLYNLREFILWDKYNYYYLNENHIEIFKGYLDIIKVTECIKLSNFHKFDIIYNFSKYVDKNNIQCSSYNQVFKIVLKNILTIQKISDEDAVNILKIINQFDLLDVVLKTNIIPEQYILNYLQSSNISLSKVFTYQKVSEDFIKKYVTKDLWLTVSTYQKLSENFILNNIENIFFTSNVIKQITEEFIDKNIYKILENIKNSNYDMEIFWDEVCALLNLSDNFLEKFTSNYLISWDTISRFASLSDDFIILNFDKINIDLLATNIKFLNREHSDTLKTFLRLKSINILNEVVK